MKRGIILAVLTVLGAISLGGEDSRTLFSGSNYRSAWNATGSMRIVNSGLSLSGDGKVGQLVYKRPQDIRNFLLEFDVTFLSFEEKTTFGIDFYRTEESGLKLDFNSAKIQLLQRRNKVFRKVASQDLNLQKNKLYRLKLQVEEENVKVEFAGIVMNARIQGMKQSGGLNLIGIGPVEISGLSLVSLPGNNRSADSRQTGTAVQEKDRIPPAGSFDRSEWNPVGNMKVTGEVFSLPGNTAVGQLIYKKSAEVRNFILEFDINFAAFGGKTTFGTDFRKTPESGLKLDFNSTKIQLLQRQNKIFRKLADRTLSLRWNEWYHLRLEVNEKNVKVDFAGTNMEINLSTPAEAGGLNLIGIGPAEFKNLSFAILPEKKTVKRNMTPASNSALRVFSANGIYYHIFGTSAAELKSMGAAAAEERFLRHTQNGDFLTKEAASAEILPDFNAVLLVNVNAPALSSSGFLPDDLEKFVRSGGGLVILGGQFSYGAGGYAGTAMERLCPVETRRVFDRVRCAPAEPLQPVLPDHPILSGVSFEDHPVVFWRHEVNLKPGSAVVLNAGEHPLLVVRRFGKGRVAAFLGTAWGDSEKQLPFWRSASWKKILINTLNWAAGLK